MCEQNSSRLFLVRRPQRRISSAVKATGSLCKLGSDTRVGSTKRMSADRVSIALCLSSRQSLLVAEWQLLWGWLVCGQGIPALRPPRSEKALLRPKYDSRSVLRLASNMLLSINISASMFYCFISVCCLPPILSKRSKSTAPPGGVQSRLFLWSFSRRTPTVARHPLVTRRLQACFRSENHMISGTSTRSSVAVIGGIVPG